MKILVIGGAEFIGLPLVRQLAAAGHEVAVFHRGSTETEFPHGIEKIYGDRNNRADLETAARHFPPEIVVDMVLSSGRQAEALMQVFCGVACRVAAVSSMDVYRAAGVLHGSEPGALEPVPLTEDSALRTRPVYSPQALKTLRSVFSWVDEAYDKVPVERAVMSNPQLPGTVLRLPMVYGPGDPLHRFFPILKRIEDGRTRILFSREMAEWRGPRGYVENVAHAIALAATDGRATGRIYNVDEEPAFSELDWARKVAATAGWKGEFVVLEREHAPQHLLPPGNAAQHWTASSQRIRRELDYREPVALEEAIRCTIEWERAHSPEQVDPRQFDYDAEDEALAAQRRRIE
ncbi:MAG TPA: NAD-dependent epimerase/dehydratase family protein [Terriglobales bacterium]|nr:NAD-dependent epimerase/dehydratase family protein [Terriglobales bacterium]